MANGMTRASIVIAATPAAATSPTGSRPLPARAIARETSQSRKIAAASLLRHEYSRLWHPGAEAHRGLHANPRADQREEMSRTFTNGDTQCSSPA